MSRHTGIVAGALGVAAATGLGVIFGWAMDQSHMPPFGGGWRCYAACIAAVWGFALIVLLPSVTEREGALIAMDSGRTHGAIIEVPQTSDVKSPVVLRLAPLVTVVAKFRTSVAGKSIHWSHASVELPWNPTNPLALTRLISCGSFDSRFEVKLPPGTYRLNAYAITDPSVQIPDLRVHPAPTVTVRGTDARVDIGVLDLTLAPPFRSILEDESKRAGRWKDYTEHYGEPAPDWHSVDGRGIDHEGNLRALRGKWVLLYFWGAGCPPCLGHGIPKMMEFYEKNSKSRERFEVVGLCIDCYGEINEMSKLDEALSSIEANIWNGAKIPFPIVLDNTFQTFERYGVPGLGTVVLVDPEGRIIEGDESTLQAILDEAEPVAASEGR